MSVTYKFLSNTYVPQNRAYRIKPGDIIREPCFNKLYFKVGKISPQFFCGHALQIVDIK